MPPRKTTAARRSGAMVPVSPRSNSPRSDAGAVMKIDSPSEKQHSKPSTADENAIMDDDEADYDMGDEEVIDDGTDPESRPYKRVCRGRNSALSAAMNESTRKSDFSKPIIVRVGSVTNSQDFHIHAARLADSSPYFDDLLEKQQQQQDEEQDSKQIKGKQQQQQKQKQDSDTPLLLPDDDPLAFQLYAHYIYDKSSISDLDLTSPTSDSRTAAYDTYIDLLHTYIFGEKIQNSDFQNEIMNRILQSIRSLHNNPSSAKSTKSSSSSTVLTPSSENIVRPLIELLYPALPPDSIGRGLVVETFIVLWSHSDILQNFVPEMTRELLTEIAEMLLSGDKDHIRDAWAQAIDGDYSYYHSARYDEH